MTAQNPIISTPPHEPRTQPSNAFIAASWVVLLAGLAAFIIGLWNGAMPLNEKGYYFMVLMYSLFSVISLQKSVRDRLEGIPVTNIYYSLSWFFTVLCTLLLTIGLWNATLILSEKGFYAMSFLLSMFVAIAVQKNTRDSSVRALLNKSAYPVYVAYVSQNPAIHCLYRWRHHWHRGALRGLGPGAVCHPGGQNRPQRPG